MEISVPTNAISALRYERIQGNKVYIGNHLAGTLEGNKELGFIIKFPNRNGNGYAPNITRALRKSESITGPAVDCRITLY